MKHSSLKEVCLARLKASTFNYLSFFLIILSVVYAYEQCLLCFGHHPDIWFEYASYVEENSNRMADKGDMNHHKSLQEDVAGVFDRGISGLLKENVLLHFCFADFEEVRHQLCFIKFWDALFSFAEKFSNLFL